MILEKREKVDAMIKTVAGEAVDAAREKFDLERLALAKEREEEAAKIVREFQNSACDCAECARATIGQLKMLFLGVLAIVFVTLSQVGCGGLTDTLYRALGTTITVDSTADALQNDGNCTLREAFRAAMTNAAVDHCPAGAARPAQDQILVPPGHYVLSIGGVDNTSQAGDLDIVETVAVLGTSTTSWAEIDANGVDRVLHMTGNAGNVELAYLILEGGCANGPSASAGDCRATVGGSAPVGAGFYDNSNANLNVHDVLIRNNRAQSGGGFGICKPVVSTSTLARVNCEGNTAWAGGGACEASHASFGWHDSTVSGNHLLNGGRGSVRQYGNPSVSSRAALFDLLIEDNDEGLEVDRGGVSSNAERITMVGGAIRNNGSIASGAGARAFGGTIALVDVDVSGNTADLAGWPAGSGGGLACELDGAYGCRIEIRGSTDVSGNADLSATPSWAPDCLGTIDVYDSATIGDASGCTVAQH